MPGRISPYLVQRRLARVMLNAQNNMAAKNNSKETRGRKWREVELKVFATVLADDRNEFALTLETLALKKCQPIFIFFKILRKNSMLVCRRRTYHVLRKEKRRQSRHQLSSCEQNINCERTVEKSHRQGKVWQWKISDR